MRVYYQTKTEIKALEAQSIIYNKEEEMLKIKTITEEYKIKVPKSEIQHLYRSAIELGILSFNAYGIIKETP